MHFADCIFFLTHKNDRFCSHFVFTCSNPFDAILILWMKKSFKCKAFIRRFYDVSMNAIIGLTTSNKHLLYFIPYDNPDQIHHIHEPVPIMASHNFVAHTFALKHHEKFT